MDGHFLVIAQIDSRSSREKSSGFVKRYLNVRVSSILCTQFVHNMSESWCLWWKCMYVTGAYCTQDFVFFIILELQSESG